MKHSYSIDDTCFSIDVIDEILEEDFDALLYEGRKILHSIEGTLIEEEIFSKFDEFMAMTADENSESESNTEEPSFKKITINTDYKIKTSLKEPPTDLELKHLPDNLEYVFVEEPSFLPVIISSKLSTQNKSKLIQLLDDMKPVIQKQRRLNPNMQEVVKKEIVKLCDTGIIYPIVDSPCVSPIHCVPKKGGITVVTNENDKLIPTRTVMGWRVCIDYRKINEATAKEHFPLLFKVQMLERLAGNKYFCFLDGFSGYFQIPIDPMDQEKTTFTCLFGTYAYRRMPFGLCNAPATFQRCMLAIFHDMIEESSNDDNEVDDNFPGEPLMEINTTDEPWFADFANYLVADIIPKGMTYQQKNKFFSDLKHYFWEEPYLFKVCSNGSLEDIPRSSLKGTQRFSSAKSIDQTECHKCSKKGHFHKPELRPTKDFEAKYNKIKDEEEVSSDDNEMVEVKVLMALAKHNDAISKESARNGEGGEDLHEKVDQLTECPSSSGQKDLVYVKSSADDTKVSILDVERLWLSEAEGFILPNHDTGRILPPESQRNTADPLVAVTYSSATEYDSADDSSVCSTPLPLLKKLDGDEPISRPKTIKSILKSKSIIKAKTLKGVIINEPSLAPTKGNKNSSASKVNSALAGKLKSVKIKDDPPLAIEIRLKMNLPDHRIKQKLEMETPRSSRVNSPRNAHS
ncbi:reverse transcriptase domain-containing protein [Tanacetum coccineum]